MAMRAEIASPVSKGVTISAGKVINPYLKPSLKQLHFSSDPEVDGIFSNSSKKKKDASNGGNSSSSTEIGCFF